MKNSDNRLSRRCFLGSAFAMAGAYALAGERLGKPDLTVGVLSDIHLSPPDIRKSDRDIRTFERMLRFYQRRGADAVLIAGDLTNSGCVREVEITKQVWEKVFGKDGGPVKIFVTGNHERNYFEKAKREKNFEKPAYADGLYRDIKKNWATLWGEPWSPFFIKEVKGYTFVGAHWSEWHDDQALRRFLAAHEPELKRAKPFFYVQHAHPQDTCYGHDVWDRANGGKVAEILSGYPNAVSFSGHTHYTLVDERSVWQGGFTSVGTAALRCVYVPPGRDNSSDKGRTGYMRGGSQGMLMSVFGDEIVLERYDLTSMAKLGDDWVIPVLYGPGNRREFAFENRAKKSRAPEFPAATTIKLSVRNGTVPRTKQPEKQLVLSFPAGKGYGDSLSRCYDYQVDLKVGDKVTLSKLVYTPGVMSCEAKVGKTATCLFGQCELPQGDFKLVVYPRNSYAVAGRPVERAVTAAEIDSLFKSPGWRADSDPLPSPWPCLRSTMRTRCAC